jgi:myosin-crossreactive antigen
LPVPTYAANFAFVSQFVERLLDPVLTMEFLMQAAQILVYQRLTIQKYIPPV